jgi:hypothetical protein
MRSTTDIILTARVMPVRKTGSASDIARFVRYVQYRDIHPDSKAAEDVDDLIAYVHHRDQTSPRGRMFGATGPAGDHERSVIVDHVARSNAELLTREKPSTTSQRAAYRLIISPEDARGLNLQRLTRAAMARLEADSGGDLPPWIAGEHRNTKHPHVHVVLAARRENAPGNFRTLVITRERLQAMKDALHQELHLQREAHLHLQRTALRAGEAESKSRLHTNDSPSPSHGPMGPEAVTRPVEILAWTGRDRWPHTRFDPALEVASIAGRLSRYHRREAERLARRRRQQHDEDEMEGRNRDRRR